MQKSPAKIPKLRIRLDCGNYLVRTVTVEDASERWGSWMADPDASHMLNAPPRQMKKSDIASYIETFDQRSRVLLGIFEKESWKHLGIIRCDIDYERSRCLVNLLIGEPEYRNKGVTREITAATEHNTFVTLGLKTMVAMALSHNQPIINYLLTRGWILEQTVPRHVKSHADGTMLDVCFFTLSREAWLAREQSKQSAPQASTEAETGKDR